MRVLVTGAAGRLGSIVVPTLVARGFDVIATDRRAERAGIVQCELADLTSLTELCRGIDVVVHLASSRWREPAPVLLPNILGGTSHVLKACLANGIRRLLFASSVQVIAPEGDPRLEVAYLPLDGDSPANPRNPYGAAKAAAEVLLREASEEHGLHVTTLRFPLLVTVAEDGPWGRRLRPWAGRERATDLAGGLSCLSFHDAARLIGDVLKADLPGYRSYLPAVTVVAPALIPDYVARYYPGVELRAPAERMRSLIDLSVLEHDFGWRPLDLPTHAPPPPPAPAPSPAPVTRPGGSPRVARSLLAVLPRPAWVKRLVAARRRRRAMAQVAKASGFVYSADYVSGNRANWESLFGEFRGRPGVHFLEVGSYEGRSAVWFLENILTDATSHLTCVDLFGEPEILARFEHNVRVSGAGARVTRLAGRSADLLSGLGRESFDAVYVDGSHAAADVALDGLLAWTLLRPGGILLFDDYQWEIQLRPAERPQMAIDLFLEALEGRLELLFHDYQVAVRKL